MSGRVEVAEAVAVALAVAEVVALALTVEVAEELAVGLAVGEDIGHLGSPGTGHGSQSRTFTSLPDIVRAALRIVGVAAQRDTNDTSCRSWRHRDDTEVVPGSRTVG